MSIRVVLFEDNDDYAKRILEALAGALKNRGSALRFDLDKKPPSSGPYQDLVEMSLRVEPYMTADLIVADYDLSGSLGYPGLSEQQVRAAADRLAIPECGYARGTSDSSGDFVRLSRQREASIVLEFRPGQWEHLAQQAVSVAEGFAFIARQMPATSELQMRRPNPGVLLADILGKPEYAEKIALYVSGDQDRRVGMVKDERDDWPVYRRKLSCSLGYWLWDSLLRYPGVLVNRVAAASYLNIHDNDFEQQDVQELFAAAQYSGPFADATRPQWWRGMLDDIVADSGFSDGREFASSKLGRDVRRSECSVDPRIPAGYYCMLSRKPVSLENSEGGLPWFPRGADLARVSKSVMEELGPWL
jgi:hypothetical protein